MNRKQDKDQSIRKLSNSLDPALYYITYWPATHVKHEGK